MAIATQKYGASGPRFGSIAVAADRTKAFRQAIRHSGRVRVLKVLLPILAVCTCGLYIAPSKWKFEMAGNEVVLDAVDVSSGDLKMTNPRIKGQNKTQGKYDVRAVSATQTIADPDTLNLNEIDADVINASGETTTLKAPGGIYRSKLEEMNFNQGVVIERSSGLIARLKSASAYFAKNLVISKEPVEVLLRESVIRANALDLYTDRSNAVFTGNVSVHLVREATAATAAQPSPQPAAPAAAASYQLDPKKPIDITSNSLEVDDVKKLAIFRVNVNAAQGEFNIKSNELQVSYAAMDAAKDAVQTPGAADIKYIEARGDVLVISKDNQTARADKAVYDSATQRMTLIDNVTVAQDKNVIQSDSVILDAASGKSFFKMNLEKRLKAVFTPKGAPDPGVPVKVAAKPEPVKPDTAAPGALITSADAKKPINIEARSLEVDDRKQIALFRENVSATQGDFNIRSKELEVAYATAGGAKTASTAQSSGDIKTIIAKGKVLVVSKEQNASSDRAVFDVKSQTVTLTENVIVTQGKNIIKGDRLVIDLTTGQSTFQMKDNGRTSAVFEAKGDLGALNGDAKNKEKKGAEKKDAP